MEGVAPSDGRSVDCGSPWSGRTVGVYISERTNQKRWEVAREQKA